MLTLKKNPLIARVISSVNNIVKADKKATRWCYYLHISHINQTPELFIGLFKCAMLSLQKFATAKTCDKMAIYYKFKHTFHFTNWLQLY